MRDPLAIAGLLLLLYIMMIVLFWLSVRYLALRAGEKLIDQLDSVEDTKGNTGETGHLCCIVFLWYVLHLFIEIVACYTFGISVLVVVLCHVVESTSKETPDV